MAGQAAVRGGRAQGTRTAPRGGHGDAGANGFGADSRIHTAKILRLSEDLPIVIEIVDSPEKIAELVLHLEQMVKGGLVTIESGGVLIYSPSGKAP